MGWKEGYDGMERERGRDGRREMKGWKERDEGMEGER